MALIDIKIPNIGDFKDVEIIEILVKEGQNISKGESLITLESDKSSVEVPSNQSGKIIKINVKVGDKVSEGDLLLKIESNKTEIVEINDIKKNKPKDIKKIIDKVQDKTDIIIQNKNIEQDSNKLVLASPKVRKFARELGTDVNKIVGSEKFGRVTEDDVKNFVRLDLNKIKPILRKFKSLKLKLTMSILNLVR